MDILTPLYNRDQIITQKKSLNLQSPILQVLRTTIHVHTLYKVYKKIYIIYKSIDRKQPIDERENMDSNHKIPTK